MSEFERLTNRNEEGEALIAEDVEEFQPCLPCGEEHCEICSFAKVIDRLAEYEDSGLSPSEVVDLARDKTEGRLAILPSKSDEIIRIIELALRIKLYDWQKAYITGASNYVMPGRTSGRTTAYMVKLCLSEGEPIDLTKQREIERYADAIHGSKYFDWFKHHLWDIYSELERVGGLKFRKIYFSEKEKVKRCNHD